MEQIGNTAVAAQNPGIADLQEAIARALAWQNGIDPDTISVSLTQFDWSQWDRKHAGGFSNGVANAIPQNGDLRFYLYGNISLSAGEGDDTPAS